MDRRTLVHTHTIMADETLRYYKNQTKSLHANSCASNTCALVQSQYTNIQTHAKFKSKDRDPVCSGRICYFDVPEINGKITNN